MLNLKKNKIKALSSITLIDFMIGILGLLFVGFLLFHFRRKRSFVYVDLTFQRQDWNTDSFPPEYWEVNKLHIGQTGYNSAGKEMILIEEIEKNIWDGGRRMYIEIAVRLDAVYNTTTKTYVYDGNPLLVGKELSLNFDNTAFTGIISNVYENQNQRFADYQLADAEIKVRYRNYDPWHAEAIRDFTVKNSKDEVVLNTKSVEISPAKKVVVTDIGEVLLRWNPIKKDVVATFELPNVLCINNICYYNHYQTFMIGEEFWADSGNTYVRGGSVMSVKIKPKK